MYAVTKSGILLVFGISRHTTDDIGQFGLRPVVGAIVTGISKILELSLIQVCRTRHVQSSQPSLRLSTPETSSEIDCRQVCDLMM